jgi:hypothetical protein
VDTKTNTSYEGKTNSVGSYTFHDLAPGPGYTVPSLRQASTRSACRICTLR